MARIRTLKPSFWGDPDVCNLSRDARLTAIAIISYADDRGRLEFSAAAIRGHAFRHDTLTDRRVHGWMTQVAESPMASSYAVSGLSYLWLPKFWFHQVINRPTESFLPAHPDDPYGHLKVGEALKQFRDKLTEDSLSDSVSTHGGLSASRAGARSLPIPTPGVGSSNSNDKGLTETQAENELFDYWRERCGHPDAKFTADRRAKLRARRREGYSDDQIRGAIDGAAAAPFVNDAGKRFDDLELICRTGSKLESFIGRSASAPAPLDDYERTRAERSRALRERIEKSGLAI